MVYQGVIPETGDFGRDLQVMKDRLFLGERLSILYLTALAVMIAGSALVVRDTLVRHHSHMHQHTFTHTHDGVTHTHTVTHTHGHDHYITDERHGHRHTVSELEKLPGAVHGI